MLRPEPGLGLTRCHNDVFVLGAGFSRAVSDFMPLTDELGVAALGRSGLAGTPGVPAGFSGGDFETWLSRQAEAQPYRDQKGDLAARARYQAFADALVEVLAERIQQALADPVPEWLTTLLIVCQARRSTLLTFNYDPLVECALDAATVWDWSSGQRAYWWRAIGEVPPPAPTGWAMLGPDGPIACLRLLKLHGSTNWYWTPGDAGGASLARRDLPGRVPLVVPPTAAKSQFYAEPLLRENWGQAAEALAAPTPGRVFLVGYSLPLTDLVTAGLLQDSVDTDRTHLYVADHSAGPVAARLDRLGLGPVGTWSGSGAVAEMIAELADEAARDSRAALADAAAADPDRRVVASRPDGTFSTVVTPRADGADVVLEVAGAWATLPAVTIPSPTPAVSLGAVLPLLAGAGGRLLVEDAGRRSQVAEVGEHRQDTGQGHGHWAVAVTVA